MSRVFNPHEPNVVTDTAIFFYTPTFYAFDSFSAFAIEIWDNIFPTAEHAYQWKKFQFSQSVVAEQILSARSARDTKVIADQHKDLVSPDWHGVKASCMEEIVRAKCLQHEKIRTLLAETGSCQIIENSPTDSYWGAGPDGDGQNQLGKIWMKLRDELQ